MKIIRKIIGLIVPWAAEKKAREIILNNKDASFTETSLDGLSVEVLKMLNDREMESKKSLEDKSKINIIGITVTITIMMHSSSLLSNIKQNGIGGHVLYCSVFLLLIVATLYFLVAGINSIKCFNSENRFRFLKPINENKDTTEARKDYKECIIENRKMNLIRNNMINVSYQCMRNALVLLFIVLCISFIAAIASNHC